MLPWDGDLLALHRAAPTRYPHLLESAARGLASSDNRHDILFAFPGATLAPEAGFLSAFDAVFAREKLARDPAAAELPFRGGWFVYLGYELAGEIEPTLRLPQPDGLTARLPTACAVRVPAAVLRDRIDGTLTLIAEDGQEHLLDLMQADLAAFDETEPGMIALEEALTEDDPARHLAAVAKVRDYIFAGDIFQANLSRAWRGRLRAGASHADLYESLRARNPSPFAALATFGDTAIVSSSPERLLRVRGDIVDTRPIAGTHPRGQGEAEDAALSAQLIAHPKERAEHIMLVDLERNDLSRVCLPGSVVVDEMMAVETYAHVHHIVSNVRGRLQPGVTPGAIIAAHFPGGTITGCPKVRCMEILAELEGEARGPYTGSLGYVNRDGDMDFNILIRTMLRVGDDLLFRAGGGIVADSIPERELAETRAKARGLVKALNADE
ncbi:MAG TPA: aminodeoxychorismate synthase component I [Alphaproteobacteria bacterium]|nr:aminodeoxychorismate synthase component I [Alphaproteobacteria bacterium]